MRSEMAKSTRFVKKNKENMKYVFSLKIPQKFKSYDF